MRPRNVELAVPPSAVSTDAACESDAGPSRSSVCTPIEVVQSCCSASMAVSRLAGSTARSLEMKSFAESEMCPQYRSGNANSPRFTLAFISASVLPWNGGEAHSKMYVITPTAHMSHARP